MAAWGAGLSSLGGFMISDFITRAGVRAFLLAGVAFSLPACATVTRGSSQQFTVQSTPPGAQVSTSNGFECQATPCTFRMPRKDGFRATVSMDGGIRWTQVAVPNDTFVAVQTSPDFTMGVPRPQLLLVPRT